jgi:molybdenum cofactor guanylyltransferase
MAGDTTGPPVSIVILAGGQSRRMGRDKAFIEFDGRPLIARVIERVRALSSDLIIVANSSQAFESFGTRLVGDVYPGKGSLGGLYSGLEAAREQYVVALACDMPFVNADLIAYLVSQAPGFDVVIPRAKDPSGKSKRAPRFHDLIAREIDLHPLHAIYAKSCMEPIRARLTADDLRIIGFLDSVRVRTVEQEDIDRYDPRHLSFFNLNTPEAIEIASHYGI